MISHDCGGGCGSKNSVSPPRGCAVCGWHPTPLLLQQIEDFTRRHATALAADLRALFPAHDTLANECGECGAKELVRCDLEIRDGVVVDFTRSPIVVKLSPEFEQKLLELNELRIATIQGRISIDAEEYVKLKGVYESTRDAPQRVAVALQRMGETGNIEPGWIVKAIFGEGTSQ